ncbi:MAG: MCE family protein [Rhodobacterales bacterium]|nr:MCE family protein [Rhodobacterales bacterium]
MSSITTELKVGAFTLVAVAMVGFGYLYTFDGVRSGQDTYTVNLTVPNADGIWEGTSVRLAGVDIGAVDLIELDGSHARLKLSVLSQYELPADSLGELRSSGMLGERFVAVDPGRSSAIISDEGHLTFGDEPGDLDAITRQVELISEDIKAITGAMREVAENRDNADHLEATMANVDALSMSLRLIAEQNRTDVNAIVASVARLTTSLESFTVETSRDVDEEMDKLHLATDTLNAALDDVEHITSKVNAGEGTLGALVNDRQTIDALNDTLDNANAVIESFSGLHAKVYYFGRLYLGSQPNDPSFFYGNPLAPNLAGGLGYSGSNTIGMELHPSEDFWWIFEVNDYPQGKLTSTEHYFPEQGTHYTEWTRSLDYRFTFQMAKRWYNLGLRLGIKEGGGGLGVTYYTLNDRLLLMVDVFDFTFGAYPALQDSGIPNVRLSARAEPIDHLWFETGTEQVILGAKYGYYTGYLGGGFHFTDDDVKLLFSTLPLGL